MEEDSSRVAAYYISKGYRAYAIRLGYMALKEEGFPICSGKK
jgi:hypothetical protein